MNPAVNAMEVRVGNGILRGDRRGEVAVFKGIPFAAPPVGRLRWAPPAPVADWEGVRDATGFAADPMQRVRPKTSMAPAMGEDCLYLNVWSPAAAGEKRPVMVWLFGGGFVGGSAADSNSDVGVFADRGVVSVSINYRVGIFGFLAHPELVAESPHGSAGNYGVLDCIAALRWIRENIAAFGGDPERVTLFGVSAGSAILSLLATSPLAAGLFSGLILESPGSFRPLAGLAEAASSGGALGDLGSLRALPADTVLAMELKLIPAMRKLTAPRVLRPILDGWIIPNDEREAFRQGRFAAVPTIVGSNADEGSKLVASWPVDTLQSWKEVLRENFPGRWEDASRLYPAASDQDARRAVSDVFADTQFQLGARELARSMGARQANVFRYVFTRQREGTTGGPHHGGEVPYVFAHHNIPSGPTAGDLPLGGRDVALANAFQKAWVEFATTRSPGTFDGVKWLPAQQGYLLIGDEVRMEKAWREDQLDFVDDFLGQLARGSTNSEAIDASGSKRMECL